MVAGGVTVTSEVPELLLHPKKRRESNTNAKNDFINRFNLFRQQVKGKV
jgi:hypothetical protein